MKSERRSLLESDTEARAPPPPYSALQDDLSSFESEFNVIRCEVCNYKIKINTKKNKKIVTCARCSQSTALGPPDIGKIYLRCSKCSCLLIANENAQCVKCPRQQCKSITDVNTRQVLDTGARSRSVSQPGNPRATQQYRIRCVYCFNVFEQHVLPENDEVRCSVCNKKSKVGERCTRRSAIMYICAGLVSSTICLTLMLSTIGERHNSGYSYLSIVLLSMGVLLILRGLAYLCMRRSVLEVVNVVV